MNIDKLELFINKELGSRLDSLEKLKQKAINLINTNQDASEVINSILKFSPINEDAIKFILLNSLNFGQTSELIETALLVRVIYDDNVELLYMAALAFEYVNMYSESIACLEYASLVAINEEQIHLLSQEINRIKERKE